MRLVSWNCCDAFDRKFVHLEQLHPEIAVVSEVRPTCLRQLGLLERSTWVGDAGQKGLAVILGGEWKITGEGPRISEKWFSTARISNGTETLQIVGVWLDTRSACAPATLAVLDQLGAFADAAPTIFAGDFNQSVTLDARHRPGRRFANVLDRLTAAWFTSAWHAHTGERQGQESIATHYWRRKRDKPFHIDFIFYPPEFFDLNSVSLGTYEQYVETKISDHVPVTADLVLRSNTRR